MSIPADPTLSQKQRIFARLVGTLLDYIYSQGFECTLGEAYRTPEQAALNAQHGTGISHSEHTKRLAIDLLLWKDNQYLTKTTDYADIGNWWVQQHSLARWGGNFHSLPDGNHFSLEDGGFE
jgi:hypothetical protein